MPRCINGRCRTIALGHSKPTLRCDWVSRFNSCTGTPEALVVCDYVNGPTSSP